VRRHVPQNDSSSADLGVVTDGDRAQYFCADSYDHAIAERWMPFPSRLPSPAQGHRLVERNVVTNDGCFSDDDAHTVVNEQPTTKRRSGMDLNSRKKTANVRDNSRNERYSATVKSGGDPMEEKGMQARIGQQDLEV
jgi:hypothetical protein